MAGGLLSEDLAAVCLLLAGGNLRRNFADIARAADSVAETRGHGWLGIDCTLSHALAALLIEVGGPAAAIKPQAAEIGPWLGHMLNFAEVYSCEEGIRWIDNPLFSPAPERRRLMILARNTTYPSSNLVLALLARLGYDSSILTIDSDLLITRWEDRYAGQRNDNSNRGQ